LSSRPLRGFAAVLGLVSLYGGLALVLDHPLSAPAASAVFLGWTVVTLRWPRLWLTALPALLPILSLNAWSGRVIFDEFDLAVLGLAAAGYEASCPFDAYDRRGAPVMRKMRVKPPCVTVNTRNSLIFQNFYDRPRRNHGLFS
jgi:hypothetical protein